MTLTIANWIIIVAIGLVGIGAAIYFFIDDFKAAGIISILITIIVCLVVTFGFSWYNTHTANGQRNYKDFESNFNGGLNREITITAEDGREIFHYEGKIDVETKHEGNANYILFESEDGRRYIIYYGITDTVLIIEKKE